MKLKFWLNILTFVAIGVVLYFARGEIGQALQNMRQLNPWVLILVLPAQLFAFFCVAKIYDEFFKATGSKVSLKTLYPAVIELNFVNHVFPSGGVSGFSYLTYRLKRQGVPAAKATLAQIARYACAFATFILMLMLSVFLLSIEDRASGIIILIATAMTTTIVFWTIGLVYVVSSKGRTSRFVNAVVGFINRVVTFVTRSRRTAVNTKKLEQAVEELHQDYMALRGNFKRMRLVLLWSFLSNIAEVSVVYVAFAAHGELVNPGAVAIAYSVAVIAGLIAILPGGVGVYEPLMVTILLAGGIPADLALSAVLVARVCAMGIALGIGWVLYQLTLRRFGKQEDDLPHAT